MNIPLILLQTVISLIPVILIKKYITNKNNLLLCICLLCYLIMMILYIKILKTGELSKVYSVIQVLQVVIVVLVGVLFFHEKLSFEVVTGIIMGLVSIYLLTN